MKTNTRSDSIKPQFIKLQLKKSQNRKDKLPEEGDGTMSAITQNHVYNYGKKKQDAKNEHILSSERLKEIKESLEKYRIKK